MKEKIELDTNDKFEELLLELVQTEEDLEQRLLREQDERFLYYLSPIRQNVISWFDFKPTASLLEVDAECGVITSFFCESVERVVAVEASKRKAAINAARNKQYENLEIVVGDFINIDFEQKFDYISLIGAKGPLLDLLKKAKGLLNPGGKLLMAIENKYGLKYWAGAPEAQTGNLFAGIEGYEDAEYVCTYSRKTLKTFLQQAGFEQQQFYYPVPDYKMPLEIYSEKHLPKSGNITGISPAYDGPRYEFFDERLAFNSICEDGLFEEFANSFIVISE